MYQSPYCYIMVRCSAVLMICDVGLMIGEYLQNCLCVPQWYEQFLQVGRQDRASVSLSLALLSSECLRIFGVHGAIDSKFFCYILYCSYWRAECGEIGHWPGWLTVVIQCYDTVGWIIWPVKLSQKWPIMCRVGCYTLLNPLTSSWPHLRCDVGLEEGEYK